MFQLLKTIRNKLMREATLCAAQDHSISADCGVVREFSLLKGCSTSYPETTGYLIPTSIDFARRMLD